MKRPKIAVLASYFPTRDEAHRGHSAYQTLRKMHPYADIEAVCTSARYPNVSLLRPRGFVARDVDLSWSPPDVKAHYATYPALPLVSRATNGVACFRAAAPILDRIQPDLILNYWLYPEGWVAVKWAQRRGIPAIVCSVGSDLRRIEDAFTRQATQWTVRQADFVLTVSHELRAQALALGAPPDRSRAILNGCDTSVFRLADRLEARAQLGVDPSAELLVYVGNIIPTKGVFEMLEAFAQSAAKRPRLELIFAGRGQSLEPLRQRAEALSIASRVRFTGVIPSAQVATWMTACNLFCLPSYSEGCPNVVIEALASGRPVLASNVGGIPELITPSSGVLIKPKDVPDLAAGLERALSTTWDEPAIARTYERSWEQVARETWDVCREVLERPRTSKHGNVR